MRGLIALQKHCVRNSFEMLFPFCGSFRSAHACSRRLRHQARCGMGSFSFFTEAAAVVVRSVRPAIASKGTNERTLKRLHL